jgi:hypothetical protein
LVHNKYLHSITYLKWNQSLRILWKGPISVNVDSFTRGPVVAKNGLNILLAILCLSLYLKIPLFLDISHIVLAHKLMNEQGEKITPGLNGITLRQLR